MSLGSVHGRPVVWLTFFVALLLQIMPIPAEFAAWRPDWIVLVIIYWVVALPHRYNILTAWLLGVMLDVILGATLGIRSLAISLTLYFVVLQFQKLRNYTMWHQSLIIGLLICIYNIIIFWEEYIILGSSFSIDVLKPAVSSSIIWPWVFWFLRRVRRNKKVS